MKTLRFAPLAVLLAAGPALAHPGHHDETGLTEAVSHIATSPFHLGMIALVAVTAIGLGLIRRTSHLQAQKRHADHG